MWWALLLLTQAQVEEGARVTVALADGGTLSFVPVAAGDEDYPPAAKRVDAEGVSDLELTIETDGTVSACRLYATSGNPDLDRKSCELYRGRAAFRVSGRTRPVVVRAPVKWVLQE
jgi:protein TonB